MNALPPLSEAEFSRQVTDLAMVLGWEWAHFRPAQTARGWRTPVSGTIGAGFPDLVLLRQRSVIVAELKREGAKPTAEQERALALFRAAGVAAYLWHPSDFDQIAELLR